MSKLQEQVYSFDEDGMLRLQKDLNYIFHHLDDSNVRRLYTEYCDIKSKAGETKIEGPLLVMTGDPGSTNSTTIRLRAGWDEDISEFVFNLYGADGSPSVELDSTGDAVFRGTINTEEDIYVGNRIFLGWGGSTVLPTADLADRGMYIMQPDTTRYMAAIYSTEVTGSTVIANQYHEFEIETSNRMNITSDERLRMYMYAEWGTSDGPNSSGEIDIQAFNARLFLNSIPGFEKYSNEHQPGIFMGSPLYRGIGEVYIGDGSWQSRVLTAGEMEYDLKDDIRYMYAHNQKFIARPTTDWVERSSNYILVGSTRVITSTRGCYLQSESSNNSYMEGRSTISSLDLTVFPDGSALTSDDYVVAALWYPSTSSISSAFIKLGNSSNDYYYTNFSSSFDYGWNVQARKLGGFGTAGSPNWNNISWVSFGADLSTQGPRLNVSVYCDYIGVIRAKNSYPWYSAFQREVNSSHTEIFTPSTDTSVLVHKHGNIPCIMNTGIAAATPVGLRIRSFAQFDARLQAYTQRSNEAPSISFAFSYGSTTSNAFSVTAQLSSGVLRLLGHHQGSTFGDYLSGVAFNAFRHIELGLKRRTEASTDLLINSTVHARNDKYTAWFMLSSDPDSYREISLEAVGTTLLAEGSIYAGSPRVDSGAKITDFKVKPFNDYTGDFNQSI